jgi:hypothetical protein
MFLVNQDELLSSERTVHPVKLPLPDPISDNNSNASYIKSCFCNKGSVIDLFNERGTPREPIEKFKCHVEKWSQWAPELKAQQRNVIQRAVDKAMAICVPDGTRTHIVTPSSLAKKIMTLEFRMTNSDDLSTGIQPFILDQTTAIERQQAQALVHVYDTIMGGATATVADAQFLVTNDPAMIPSTPGQARTCLTYMRALIIICFNLYHPSWAVALGTLFLLEYYTAREVELETLQPSAQHAAVSGHGARPHRAPCSSTALFAVDPVTVELACPHPGDSRPHRTLHAADRTGSGGPGTDLSTAVSPGGAAPPVAPVPHRWPASPRPLAHGRDLLDRLADTPPPVSSHDAPRYPDQPIRVCLSYHVKGHSCNTGCGRAADHQPLTPTKRQELLAWCTEHFHAL